MDAGQISLVVAVVGTGTSAYFARRADQRAKSAEDRAERAERRELQQRQPVIQSRGRERPTEGNREGQLVHHYAITNPGPGVIAELVLWIEDADGKDISSGDQIESLAMGQTVQMSVGVLHEDRPEQRLMIRWADADDTYGPLWTGIQHPLHL